MVLSHNLKERCRAALLLCHELENDDRLAAVFVTTELMAFQDHVPRGASSKQERVDLTLAYLLPLRMNGNRPILPIFLVELASHYYDGDQLHHDLQDLYPDVQQELMEKVEVPFLIAAMTRAEAATLFDETVFNDPNSTRSQLTAFQKFQAELARQELQNLQTCYSSDVREEWGPSYCTDGSIQQVIDDILTNLNEKIRRPSNLPILTRKFISNSFFSDDHLERANAIRELRYLGGVLVIDAISMFHPQLNDRISKSSISAYDHVAILVVSPIDVTAQDINKGLNDCIEDNFSKSMEQSYTRFHTEFDQLCEIDLGNLRSLKRWFFRAIPEAVSLIEKGDTFLAENRMRFRKSRGNDQPRGMQKALPGLGGAR